MSLEDPRQELNRPPQPAAPSPIPAQDSGIEAVPQRVEIHLPSGTIIKVFAALLSAYAIYVLWPLLLLVFLALFLAVTLQACVKRLEAWGLRPRVSLLVVICGLLAVIGIGTAFLIPPLFDQATRFSENFPKLWQDVLTQLPVGSDIRQQLEHLLDSGNWSGAGSWMGHVWSAGGKALGVISQFVLLLVIAIYLLVDGKKIYDWLLAFFSPLHRSKIRITAGEVSIVIFGYVAGQVITSVLVTIYTFVLLSLFHIPAALLLAILAGLLDILPIVGFFIAAAPAFLLALSVSSRTAFIVLGLYLLFHAIEAYIIIPKVYGRSLRMSTLTVLLGLLAGALLAGIPGALAALPVIASYAAIERIWLRPFLRDGVAEKHELQKDQEFGDKP